MRKLLFVALPAGLLILLAVQLVSVFRSRGEASEARLERARLKRDFTERAGAARAAPPDKLPEWQAEVSALSRWYFDELQAIRNRHPLEPPRPNGVEAAAGEQEGKLKKEQQDQLEDFQKYAESRLALLKDGAYTPVVSSVAEGLRLDVVAVQSGAGPEGSPGLRVDFALWGAPRYVEREREKERIVSRNVVPVAFKQIAFRFHDGTDKLYGEMTGGGEPYQKLADPERFVDDFPPGVLFGTWWVELFPREAATVQFELTADVRGASGTVRPATFTAKLPVPEGWKLPPGAVYQAEMREAAPPQ